MGRPLLIYVAGPLGDPCDWDRNCESALDVANELMYKGHVPVVPHLYIHLSRRCRDLGYSYDYSQWLENDLKILARVDGLLYLGSSPGSDAELDFAQSRGIEVFRSIHEVPEVFQ